MLFREEVPSVPDLNALMPAWAQQLSVLVLLILVVSAFLKGWVVTRAQNERDMAAERRIADIWEQNYLGEKANNEKLIAALQPVLSGNEAILKAVTEVQEEQRRTRERGRPAR